MQLGNLLSCTAPLDECPDTRLAIMKNSSHSYILQDRESPRSGQRDVEKGYDHEIQQNLACGRPFSCTLPQLPPHIPLLYHTVLG